MEWTGARYADQPTVEVRTRIEAPPRRVWDLVSDIRLMPDLSAELRSVAWLDGETEPRIGARFVGRSRHESLGEWETTSYVVECEPPRAFAWAVSDPEHPSAVWRFGLEGVDGGTELTQWMRMGPGRSGLSFAIDRMPEKERKIVFVRLREFERSMTDTVEAIRKLAESAEGAGA
ncbi:SRPBCC family protein [Streptomyces sp. SAS_267]|uniref:SRPBCC family protein n=1 Tax=Streptomyces sp. SAS_267 TaxID=3412750 RepID=UPI00403C70AE